MKRAATEKVVSGSLPFWSVESCGYKRRTDGPYQVPSYHSNFRPLIEVDLLASSTLNATIVSVTDPGIFRIAIEVAIVPVVVQFQKLCGRASRNSSLRFGEDLAASYEVAVVGHEAASVA